MKGLPRPLSQCELSFLEEVKIYNQVLEFTMIISQNQGGIETNARGERGVKIFTRQTITALSLSRILPNPNPLITSDSDLWDINSIASLTRNLIEGYLSQYYFGLEKISELEAELRFFILQLHRNIEWFNIRDIEDPIEYKEFKEGIDQQKQRIKNHPYLKELSITNKNRALKFNEIYKTKSDFENELPVCKDLIKNYRLLSNLVHPLPLSIERVDNAYGRGNGIDRDIIYCLHCLMLSRRFLAASVVGIVDYFPNELAKKFFEKLEIIRQLQFEGFENN